MSVKNELQQINNRLDKCRNKLAAAKTRNFVFELGNFLS
jgi:hypothetical protein